MAVSDKVRPWGPLAVSALLHLGLALAGGVVLTVLPTAPHRAPHSDAWAGGTCEIDGLVTQHGAAGHRAAARLAAPTPAKIAAARAPAPVKAVPAERAAQALPAASGVAPPLPHAPAPPHTTAPAPAPAPAPARTGGAPDLSQAMAAAANGKNAPPGGQFGAAGVLPGVRSLAKAFTRALPRAASGDPLWSTLPLGSAGGFRVEIRIDDQRRIASAKPVHESLAPQLRHLLERTLVMLEAGQFALDRTGVTSGTETLRVELRISMRKPSDQIDVDPSDTVELGFKPPTLERSGLGYFTLASGRHVEAKVTIEPSP